ncbi:hypothetical protein FNV43_RR22212 [Rhamnella rubrinervis]|uniref:Cytochrome P450 n=1 Tax=Rhamnella rubrinervis TaxID=2594499 RepID=A0A8K0DQ21_9ROSA|nr:hypothetical protein FNV43_RR22212 [Rhamnella rubrinervis]
MEIEQAVYGIQSCSICVWVLIIFFSCYSYYIIGVKKQRIRSKLKRQGISGPLPSLVFGNVPEINRIMSMSKQKSKDVKEPLLLEDCSLSLFPYLKRWTEQFGETFIFALGGVQIMYVTNVKLVRELSIFKSLDLGKPDYLQTERGPLLGKGLIASSGSLWAHQRKTIAPHLYMYKIKDMTDLIVESANALVKSWESRIETNGGVGVVDLAVDDDVRSFTAIVISKILFGRNYDEGAQIFPKLRALLKEMASPTILNGIPFSRYFPTNQNRRVWRLEKEIHCMIMAIKEKHSGRVCGDMMEAIKEGAENAKLGQSAEDQYVADNCKNLFLAGAEIPAVSAIWGVMLLASHPHWQTRLRNELQQVFGGTKNIIDPSMLGKCKLLEMVVQEVLRLYPAIIFVSRQALKDIKIGETCIPKGVNIWIWLLELHRDPQLWGSDALQFNPERFANGVSGACKCPQAYLPFGVGSRVCPGQSLALVELKILFASIVSNFNLSVSPKYVHSPAYGLLLHPKQGVHLLVQKI